MKEGQRWEVVVDGEKIEREKKLLLMTDSEWKIRKTRRDGRREWEETSVGVVTDVRWWSEG